MIGTMPVAWHIYVVTIWTFFKCYFFLMPVAGVVSFPTGFLSNLGHVRHVFHLHLCMLTAKMNTQSLVLVCEIMWNCLFQGMWWWMKVATVEIHWLQQVVPCFYSHLQPACALTKGGRPYGVQTWQKWNDITWKEMTPNEKNEMKQNETK